MAMVSWSWLAHGLQRTPSCEQNARGSMGALALTFQTQLSQGRHLATCSFDSLVLDLGMDSLVLKLVALQDDSIWLHAVGVGGGVIPVPHGHLAHNQAHVLPVGVLLHGQRLVRRGVCHPVQLVGLHKVSVAKVFAEVLDVAELADDGFSDLDIPHFGGLGDIGSHVNATGAFPAHKRAATPREVIVLKLHGAGRANEARALRVKPRAPLGRVLGNLALVDREVGNVGFR
mmetsp:Transcript_1113/g.2715  ORF Transcript_1113/g.2715 Transcript_1113/m.2715 type:complete len:230 (+) Transcript_1113:64-753(+)